MNKTAAILFIVLFNSFFCQLYSQWVDLTYAGYYADPRLMKDLNIYNCEIKENRYSLYSKRYKENKPAWINTSFLSIDTNGFVISSKESMGKVNLGVDTFNVIVNDSVCIGVYDSLYFLNDSICTIQKIGATRVEKRYSLSGRLEYSSYLPGNTAGYFSGITEYHYSGEVLDSIVLNHEKQNYNEVHIFSYLPNGGLNESYLWYQYPGYRELSTIYMYEYGDKGLLSSIKVHYPHNPLDWHEYIFTWNAKNK